MSFSIQETMIFFNVFIIIIVFNCVSAREQYQISGIGVFQRSYAFCLPEDAYRALEALCVSHSVHFVVPHKERVPLIVFEMCAKVLLKKAA
jgi:hypothetical protein